MLSSITAAVRPSALDQLGRDSAMRANPKDLRHLILIGHPAADSFNHAVAARYRQTIESLGQTAEVRDLYAIGFDPLLKSCERPGTTDFAISADVQAELDLVANSSVIVLVYPIWFGMPPAIITGYVDRVMGAGLTPQDLRSGKEHALLAGKHLVILTTSSASLPWLASRGQWHGLREAFDFYLEAVFSFASCEHEHLDSIVSPLAPRYAGECLQRIEARAVQTASTVLHAAHRRQVSTKLFGTAQSS